MTTGILTLDIYYVAKDMEKMRFKNLNNAFAVQNRKNPPQNHEETKICKLTGRKRIGFPPFGELSLSPGY